MTPRRLASSISTSAQSSHVVNDRLMESTCPRIRLVREPSFCLSLSISNIFFCAHILGGTTYLNESESSSRRRTVVLLPSGRGHVNSFGCTPSCHPIAGKQRSICARGTPYADERTRLTDSKNIVVLAFVHGSSLHDPDKGPRRPG
jgi:hypothetical protein